MGAASWLQITMKPDSPLYARLYLDEDVHKRIAASLRLRHFDVIATSEAARCGLGDEAQLEFAAAEGRALFTYNSRDFIRLHFDCLRNPGSRYGRGGISLSWRHCKSWWAGESVRKSCILNHQLGIKSAVTGSKAILEQPA